MKAAIITFQDAINFGASLQAFALKRVIQQWGECEIINYYNDFFHRKPSLNNPKTVLLSIMNGRKRRKKEKRFFAFQEKYLVKTEKIFFDDTLSKLNGEYDLFITGSDQVWNLECSGHKTAYFLDFVEDQKKKISYAASFGSGELSEGTLIKKLLNSFYAISVREASGQKIVANLLHRQVPLVLDPTLLLTKNDWKECFGLRFDQKYVLVYEVLNGTNLVETAKRFAREKRIPLLCITSSNKPRVGMRCIKDAGPIQWLQLFAGSAYVFTNSFHGLAFSLLFEKQFAVELLPPPATTNARLIELLNMTGLSDRVISSDEMPGNSINFEEVRACLTHRRETSIQYIKSFMERDDGEKERSTE